jgi:hypothetical protein
MAQAKDIVQRFEREKREKRERFENNILGSLVLWLINVEVSYTRSEV